MSVCSLLSAEGKDLYDRDSWLKHCHILHTSRHARAHPERARNSQHGKVITGAEIYEPSRTEEYE